MNDRIRTVRRLIDAKFRVNALRNGDEQYSATSHGFIRAGVNSTHSWVMGKWWWHCCLKHNGGRGHICLAAVMSVKYISNTKGPPAPPRRLNGRVSFLSFYFNFFCRFLPLVRRKIKELSWGPARSRLGFDFFETSACRASISLTARRHGNYRSTRSLISCCP